MEQNFLNSSKRLLFAALILYVPLFSLGQTGPTNNQAWMQLPLFNPATSGVFNKIEAAAGMQYGGQSVYNPSNWVDLYNPELFVRADYRLDKINSGIGINYYNNNTDQLFEKENYYIIRQRLGVNYNYQFRINENNLLAVGLSFNLESVNWNVQWRTPGSPSPDPSLPPSTGINNAYNVGAGVFYKNRIWFAGLSMNPIIKLKQADYLMEDEYAYILISGVDAPLNESLKFYGSLLLSTDMNTNHVGQIVAKFTLKEVFYLGAGLTGSNNWFDSWQLMIGARFAKSVLVHYAYGHAISNLRTATTPIHTISVGYFIGD